MKESISLFIRQMSCEKKVVFITTDLTGGYQSWSGCWSIKKKKKIKQLIFASSQPVSNQTWRFTVAPIGLLVNCHLPTVFDPFCEHRLKCNTGITNTHNNIIHWDFSCHSEVVIQTKKKKNERNEPFMACRITLTFFQCLDGVISWLTLCFSSLSIKGQIDRQQWIQKYHADKKIKLRQEQNIPSMMEAFNAEPRTLITPTIHSWFSLNGMELCFSIT